VLIENGHAYKSIRLCSSSSRMGICFGADISRSRRCKLHKLRLSLRPAACRGGR
jgi:hypothetical protein